MTTNKFRQQLEQDRRPLQAWLWNPSTLTAEIMCAAGFDSVCVDLQHGAATPADLYGLMAVISANGSTPMVRVPSTTATDVIGWALDAGARGVIGPDVQDAEQARSFVAACKYPPVGCRGFGPVRPAIGRSAGYVGGTGGYSTTDENEAVLAIVQIESAAGLAAVDEIVAVEGLDGLFPGPVDLALSLFGEAVTDVGDPRLREPLQRIVEAAHAGGRTVGMPPMLTERIGLLGELGVDWFQVGNDVAWLTAGAGQAVEAARTAGGDRTPQRKRGAAHA